MQIQKTRKNNINKIGKPVLIENYDANVDHNFRSVDYVLDNSYPSVHYNVGFLIEQTDSLIKFGSTYITGRYKNPGILDMRQVTKIWGLEKDNDLPKELPEIVVVEWEDHQMGKGSIKKHEIVERNVLKKIHTIGFLIVQDNKRIVVAENIRQDLNKARTIRIIHPSCIKKQITLAKGSGRDNSYKYN